MKKKATKAFIGLIGLVMLIGGIFLFFQSPGTSTSSLSEIDRLEEELEKMPRAEKKAARNEFFHRILQDPATGEIPENIRSRELSYARTLPTLQQVTQKLKSKDPSRKLAVVDFDWQLAGPPATGGRTRALGIDQRDSDTIIAGGVSGGIWKSTDGGDSWELKTPDASNMSVTSLAQDPTDPDTWYYVGGEFSGNSARDRGARAFYYGNGVYRSTDNGDSWNRIPGTEDDDTQFSSQFDYVNRIIVNPMTGTVFMASNGFGIFRSEDGTAFDNLVLGAPGSHAYADITVANDGRLVAVLSTEEAGGDAENPGVFVSDDDGQTWDEITPDDFPNRHFRSVVDIAPSDTELIYVLTQKESGTNSTEGVGLYSIDLSSGIPGDSFDLSSNLPDYGDPVGQTNLQGGYNMAIAVKPDDPNVVFLGATNLFRSSDGFASSTNNDADEHWVGGYSKENDISQYENQHPDQHVIVFDPNDPDKMWVGHDGGLSVTEDPEATPLENWQDKDEGYFTTQFYDASIPSESGDDRLMGGTQDNGTPFFRYESGQEIGTEANDISSGDGAYSFFTENHIYVSSQEGRVIRWPVNSSGNIDGTFAIVQPSSASNQLFIHPYAIDPNNEDNMYYPAGANLYRNIETTQLTSQNNSGTSQGWEQLSEASLSNGYNISALEVSFQPDNVLYYGGSAGSAPPEIKKLENASATNAEPEDISIPDAPDGAYLHDIALNPANGNEILAVMSNYNIVGVYYSSDGGNSWEAVEGNLEGTESDPGPSLRTAAIISAEDGPVYVLGTSTGVYATQELDGDNTEWGQEAADEIGNSVVENIDSRLIDGDLAIGSHGRGMFLGDYQGQIEIPDLPIITPNVSEGRAEDEITISATNFEFSTTPENNEVTFGNDREVTAEVLEASTTELTVEVPRDVLDPTDDNREVRIRITNTETNRSAQPAGFTILPPDGFTIEQNYPNPFNSTTTIPVDVPEDSRLTLQIFDINGQKVREPYYDRQFNAGSYDTEVDFSGLASGIYIYRFVVEPTSGNDVYMESKKMTFIK